MSLTRGRYRATPDTLGDGQFSDLRVDNKGALIASPSSGAGVIASATFTPAAAGYSAGDIIDVAKVFNWTYADTGLAVPTSALIRITTSILKIDAVAVISGETSYALQMYSVTPPSAPVDNATWTLASADLPSYLGSVSLGTPVDLGAALYAKTGGLTDEIKLDTGLSSIYGQLVTTGAFTAAAVARQVSLRGFIV